MFNETSSRKAVPAAEINDSANRKNGLGDSLYGLGDRKNGRPNRKNGRPNRFSGVRDRIFAVLDGLVLRNYSGVNFSSLVCH